MKRARPTRNLRSSRKKSSNSKRPNKALDDKLKQLEEAQRNRALDLEMRLLKLDTAQQAAKAEAEARDQPQPPALRFRPSVAIFGDANLQVLSVDNKEYTMDERSGFYLRRAGLILGGSVDPYAHARIYVGFNEDGVELGEAYITWTAIPRTNITVGKFYQSFGKLNSIYEYQLDQFSASACYQ